MIQPARKLDNGKGIIKPGYFPDLDNAAGEIKTIRAMTEIQRHACKIGGYEHNTSIQTPSKSG